MLRELRKKLDKKQISAVELALEYLAKKDDIGAFLYLDSEQVKAQAKNAQKLIDEGKSKALTGIPLGIKDNICTLDMPTTGASKMLDGYIPPYDATVVAKLREQGAVILGKLNLDEFAMGSTNTTSYYKNVLNPHDKTRYAGGSSGGAAAAVAAGLCPVALGSDTGGSIRVPASYCGVVGYRPTYGVVSRYGGFSLASSFDQIGAVGVSAEDCAIVLECIAGKDTYDATSVDFKMNADNIKDVSLKGKRLAFIKQHFDGADSDVRSIVKNAAQKFAEKGAVLEEISMPELEYAQHAYYVITCAEASSNFGKFDGVRYGHRAAKIGGYDDLVALSRTEGFGEEVKRRILFGSYVLSRQGFDRYFLRATRYVALVKKVVDKALEKYHALVSPTTLSTAGKIEEVKYDPSQMFADLCSMPAALAGLPSVSVPVGKDRNGMPIGLMLTGQSMQDEALLGLASLV